MSSQTFNFGHAAFLLTFATVVAGATVFVVKQTDNPQKISQQDVEKITTIKNDIDYMKAGMSDMKRLFESNQQVMLSWNDKFQSMQEKQMEINYRLRDLERGAQRGH